LTLSDFHFSFEHAVKESALYIKIVERSEEDQCFVGQCPGIIGPCCHGDDEAKVYAELCQIVEEWIAIMKQDGKLLPPPTIGKNVAEKLLEIA
jgi:predicted RNase H-like HicB family nuclease